MEHPLFLRRPGDSQPLAISGGVTSFMSCGAIASATIQGPIGRSCSIILCRVWCVCVSLEEITAGRSSLNMHSQAWHQKPTVISRPEADQDKLHDMRTRAHGIWSFLHIVRSRWLEEHVKTVKKTTRHARPRLEDLLRWM